jgi:hypothetical protein
METKVIQIAPLAFMRGRTLNDAVIVLDEAQNTTTHQIKMFLTRLGMNAKMIITGDVTQIDLPRSTSSGLVQALRVLKEDNNNSDAYYRVKLEVIENILPEKDEKEFDKLDFAEMLSLFPEEDYFNKLIHVYEKSIVANRVYKYFPAFIDCVSMKNSPSMLIADSRSRKHPRRGVLGSKLLETLVQLLVLRQKEDGSYETHSLSIEDLASEISNRYGLIINGVHEDRFADADVEMNAAFKVNMDAFKNKLRQIGFYTDMSDACILQKIRPRYNLDD